MDARLRALCDLSVAHARGGAGRHEYDGRVQDLSPDGVRAGLAALGGGTAPTGAPLDDPHDEAHLAAFEDHARVVLGELELHRRDPRMHINNLELSVYDKEYAPAGERAEARARHLASWPDAVDMAVAALDRVPAPVARALLPSARGHAAAVRPEDGESGRRGLAALARFVAHLEAASRDGDPDPALGGPALSRLMGSSEAMEVDLGALAERADAERNRLRELMAQACRAYDPDRGPADLLPELLADHADADGVVAEARASTAEVVGFCRERRLAPYLDGVCEVGPAPASMRWAVAMMSWNAPGEVDAPSWYFVTPPEPDWPADEAEEWLTLFSRTTLPAITAHEVAPGHFAHARALRRVSSDVRRVLYSSAFAEGWAHYAEELLVEEGFRADDPRYTIGMCLEALVRVTRLASAIGLHTGTMDVAESTRRFMADAHLARAGAVGEARRGTFDATYGCYTWGKLAIYDLRERARKTWNEDFSLERFHRALLDLGSPPLGLIDAAIERG
ncbi:DUF885 domain-containing protein [Yinghuangia sp. ASG 101]|uniref:DUF885 family protein n=1 Tax=Yinghuangia sp. ASG 101 TaxID=2896848 RepID=UPI001E381E76|nr:DUF885 family protein [Yinghuangia sp. ASG 101]UGQ14194.1 DUF885 domain-containing protein [Yinghuangia sp. ASG 101]